MNEMLSLYYVIGGYVSGNSREGTRGTGAIIEEVPKLLDAAEFAEGGGKE